MREWQKRWDLNVVDRPTYEVLPKVSLKPAGLPRELAIFVSAHGPFPVYLKKIAVRGGLAERSRLWGRRVPGSKPDSTEDPPCMGPVAR
ncbi:hypothetical protein AVEN_119104-1 [Araneus ventricosus]|uniref:Uncharacterized protein n=1 Tax=Araneus ventricosus TaxID=182803 RepID=A0A4Y2BL93_ARAVE|nr:hypothetical protein AVEN_119104-1 [Araneus ventricosus]